MSAGRLRRPHLLPTPPLQLIAQHPDETKLNRASLLTLLQKWSRIVVRKSDDFRDIRSLVEERGTAHQRMARRGEYMLDIYNRQARAGAASAAGDAGGAGDLVEAALQQGEAGGTDAMHARVPRPLAFDYTRNVESAVDAEAARRRVKGRVDTEKAKFVKAVTVRWSAGGRGGAQLIRPPLHHHCSPGPRAAAAVAAARQLRSERWCPESELDEHIELL